jgi:hypothetical protein
MIKTLVIKQDYHAPQEPYASTYKGSWPIDRPIDPYIIVNEEIVEYRSYSPPPGQVEDPTEGFSDPHTHTVVPLSASEYARLIQKPYKYPPKDQAWRLYTTIWYPVTTTGGETEMKEKAVTKIIGLWPEAKRLQYTIRYIKKPAPIVLETGNAGDDCCELPEILHDAIVQRAVELAKAAWQGDVNTAVQLGQRSE